MSPTALRARRRNIAKAKRLRSDRETAIIKRLICQSCFDSAPRPSQRELAHKLGVRPSYVWKVQRKALHEGVETPLEGNKSVTLDDLAEARRFTSRVREEEPGQLAPVLEHGSAQERAKTPDENIAATWREVDDWKRKNLWRSDNRRRIRVPILF